MAEKAILLDIKIFGSKKHLVNFWVIIENSWWALNYVKMFHTEYENKLFMHSYSTLRIMVKHSCVLHFKRKMNFTIYLSKVDLIGSQLWEMPACFEIYIIWYEWKCNAGHILSHKLCTLCMRLYEVFLLISSSNACDWKTKSEHDSRLQLKWHSKSKNVILRYYSI